MQYNSFEERMNRKLANATMPPHTQVWDKIRQDLDEPPKNDGKKGWILGLCLLFCALGTGTYLFFKQKEPNAITMTTSVQIKTKSKEAAIPNKTITQNAIHHVETKNQNTNNQNTNNQHINKSISNKNIIHTHEAMQTKEIILVESARSPKNEEEKSISTIEITTKELEVVPTKVEVIKSAIVNQHQVSTKAAANKVQQIDKQNITTYFLSSTSKTMATPTTKIPKPKHNAKWTWSISTGTYAILYQSLFDNKVSPKYARWQEALGVANIGVGDSTSNLIVYNDQSLSVAAQSVTQLTDTSLLKITVSPNTQFATLSGEYRISRHFGIESAMSFYYQKMNRILIPIQDINSFGEAIANSKTTPYYGNTKSALAFKFYILEPKILFNTHFGAGNSDIGLGIGMAYRALVGSTDSNAALRLAQIASKDAQIYNPHNFSVHGRIKYAYHINEKLAIFSAINAQVLLNRMYSQGISYKSPSLCGMEIGLSF